MPNKNLVIVRPL